MVSADDFLPIEQVLTLLPLLLTIFLDSADSTYFHGVFRALETDLNVTLPQMGIMEGANGVAVVVFTPIWAYIADQQILDRKMILIVSTLGWGLTSIMMGWFATSFWSLLIIRIVNTAWICSGLPITQYYVGATIPAESRGKAFGMTHIGGAFGAIVCIQFSTAYSETVLMGIAGWRFGLYFLGCLAMTWSWIMYMTIKEPPKEERTATTLTGPLAIFGNLAEHWKVLSFRVLCCQGCFGNLAFQVMNFSTMWFQYCGLNDAQAGLISSCKSAGGLIGAVAGGILSDYLYKMYPLHGRQCIAQISAACAVPIVAIIFTFLPQGPDSALSFALLMFLLGCGLGMIVPGVNQPILAQTAGKNQIASMSAWEFSLEKVFGGFWGPFAISWLSAASGYEANSVKVSEMSPELRRHNVQALAFIIRSFCCVAYACVAVGYTALHWTFPRDMQSLHDKEGLKGLEADPEKASLLGKPLA